MARVCFSRVPMSRGTSRSAASPFTTMSVAPCWAWSAFISFSEWTGLPNPVFQWGVKSDSEVEKPETRPRPAPVM